MKKLISGSYAKQISFILFFAITSGAFGQIYDEYSTRNFHQSNLFSSRSAKNILSESDISGSPYLNNEFILGSILTNDKIRYIDIPLRYNIYNDDMEFKNSEDTYLAIGDPTLVKMIIIGDDKFIYTDKRKKNGEQFGYYKLLEDGEIKLLLKYNVVFKKAVPTTGYEEAEPPKLERISDTYYILQGNNEPQQISKKKDIDLIFGPKSSEIDNYIKKEKLNVKKEEDLIKLVEFVNKSN